MKRISKKSILKNQKGLATIEAVPILVLFLILISYGVGLFGVIHTGILYSIAARTYAFETFRNRANLTYFRDLQGQSQPPLQYDNFQIRVHGIQDDTVTTIAGESFQATGRPIAIGRENEEKSDKPVDHNVNIFNLQPRNREGGIEVSPAWVMIGYGICLNAQCGD